MKHIIQVHEYRNINGVEKCFCATTTDNKIVRLFDEIPMSEAKPNGNVSRMSSSLTSALVDIVQSQRIGYEAAKSFGTLKDDGPECA